MPNENDPGAGAMNPVALADRQSSGSLGTAAGEALADRQAVRRRVKARNARNKSRTSRPRRPTSR